MAHSGKKALGLVALCVTACGPEQGSPAGVAAAGSGGAPPAAGSAVPPPPDPNAPAASGKTPTTLAVRKFYLGELQDEWRVMGFDVDGLVSTASSPNHCLRLLDQVELDPEADGEGGIDNAFSHLVVPQLAALVTAPSDEAAKGIADGGPTLLIHLANLGPETSQSALRSALLGSGSLGASPSWAGTDVWPVAPESVSSGSAEPLVVFPESYVTSKVWVAAPPASQPLKLSLTLKGVRVPLVIHHVRASASLSGTGPSAHAGGGTLSGVLDADELVAALEPVIGLLDPEACPYVKDIVKLTRSAADLMKDGTNGDPSKVCDGISIGLRFEAWGAGLGEVGPAAPALPKACP